MFPSYMTNDFFKIIEWGFHISLDIQEPPPLRVLRDLQPALLRGHSRLVIAQLLLAVSPPCKGFAKALLGPPNHSAETIIGTLTFAQPLNIFCLKINFIYFSCRMCCIFGIKGSLTGFASPAYCVS